ncbi:MAG: NUDIX hydrolase [Anaerovoracaceae bacterium]|nr:NUDIX hydrolase [Anaerovoracaceae bacterium]
MWIGGARAIIRDREGKILMVCQQCEERRIWMAPGGGCEDGELSCETAVREVKEETGLDVTVERLIWHVEQRREDGETRFVDFFLCSAENDEEPELGRDPEFDDEHQLLRGIKYVSRGEMQTLDVYPKYMKDELFRILDGECPDRDVYKIREK